MKRSTYIVGNWKMHFTANKASVFVKELIPLLKDVPVHVWIAPSFTAIEAAFLAAKESSIKVGAQNMSAFLKGAYTGEVSPEMLLEAGAHFVILGHSERRQHFNESNAMISSKVRQAVKNGIRPILCIGETLDQRKKGRAEEVLEQQIEQGLKQLSIEEIGQVLIAYEPIWAIGTGMAATPEIAEKTHHSCRLFLQAQYGEVLATKIPILYGGSVKLENTASLVSMPNIDGALIGGASLEVNVFEKIIKITEERVR